MIDTGQWQAYLENLAQVAGTLFALVIAARGLVIGLRRTKGSSERTYVLIDSVASAYELAAAALLALMAGMPKANRFLAVLPLFIAAVGLGLVIATWVATLIARKDIKTKKARIEAGVQAGLSILPFFCYLAAFRVWLSSVFGVWRWPGNWIGPMDTVALAVTWLAISGTFQAIWWYRKTWVAQLSEESRSRHGA